MAKLIEYIILFSLEVIDGFLLSEDSNLASEKSRLLLFGNFYEIGKLEMLAIYCNLCPINYNSG